MSSVRPPEGTAIQPGELPPSLPVWLPHLWSSVLFSGQGPARSHPRWTAMLLLLVVPAALLYPCLSFHLFEPDEGRYAEIAREMVVRGEWIVPMLQGEPYLDKPPLLYWLTMLSYRVFGIQEWSARLAPALALHLTVLWVYFFGRRHFGERGAFWGALLLGLAPGFVSMGRLLLLDGLLCLWVTLALFAAFEAVRGDKLRWGWWLLSAFACGLGVLTKGPIAFVLLVPPLLAFRWLTNPKRQRGTASLTLRVSIPCPISRIALLVFAAIVLAIVQPWHIAVGLRVPSFFSYFFWRHNVLRFLAPFDHIEPVWFYLPVVLGGLLPGTLLLIGFAQFLLTGRKEAAERRSPGLGFLLLAAGWCLLFFTLSGSKLPTYILPAFPPLALALGYYSSGSGLAATRWPKAVATASFALLLVGHSMLVPWYARYRSPIARYEELARYCRDSALPVICYPRNCDSVAFYFEREDLRGFRSRDIDLLREALRKQPRTVVLCTHRHSLAGLRQALPPELRLVDETHFGLGDVAWLPDWLDAKLARLLGETALGLCDAAVVEHRK